MHAGTNSDFGNYNELTAYRHDKMRFQNYMTLNLTRHYKNLSIDPFSTCILQKQYLDKWVKVEDIKHDRHINE